MPESEGEEEHQPHQEEEEREAPQTAGDDVVNAVGECPLAGMLREVGLLECTRDKAIASVCDQRLSLFLRLLMELT